MCVWINTEHVWFQNSSVIMKEWLQQFAHIFWIDGDKQRRDIWEITGYQVFT